MKMRIPNCVFLWWVVGLVGVGAGAQELPKSWVDKDTGHRVWRLSDEPGSSAFYFNVNAYSADGKLMVYTAPDGIHTLELATKTTKLIVPRPTTGPGGDRTIVAGRKSNSIFFSRTDEASHVSTVYKADLYSGAVTKLVALPPWASIATVNADETLGAGTYYENPADSEKEYGRNRPAAAAAPGKPAQAGNLVQPENKGQMMERRLASRIPIIFFTVNLQTGAVKTLLHSTDWIGHMLFSPVDPTLLMYCHEGPWQKVDRIWTIRTDGTHNELMHKRTMLMEIAGHEFWGLEGDTVWYDWQTPKGEDFWLAGYDLKTKQRVAYHMLRDEWSIHFNLTQGATMFAGDGGDPGQVAKAKDGEWIYLFHPEWRKDDGGINEPSFIKPGMFRSERLVNMAHHNYRLEPNVRFSPDQTMVLFTSNMFGRSYVFGVEVAKASGAKADEIKSTPELGAQFSPVPTPTH